MVTVFRPANVALTFIAFFLWSSVVAAAPAEVRWKRNLTSVEEQLARLQGQVRAE